MLLENRTTESVNKCVSPENHKVTQNMNSAQKSLSLPLKLAVWLYEFYYHLRIYSGNNQLKILSSTFPSLISISPGHKQNAPSDYNSSTFVLLCSICSMSFKHSIMFLPNLQVQIKIRDRYGHPQGSNPS